MSVLQSHNVPCDAGQKCRVFSQKLRPQLCFSSISIHKQDLVHTGYSFRIVSHVKVCQLVVPKIGRLLPLALPISDACFDGSLDISRHCQGITHSQPQIGSKLRELWVSRHICGVDCKDVLPVQPEDCPYHSTDRKDSHPL